MGGEVPATEVFIDAGFNGCGEFVRRDVAGDRGSAGEEGLDLVHFSGIGPQLLHGGGELRLAGE